MATLCFDFDPGRRAGTDLQQWLRQDWAVLLSNPQDFQHWSRGGSGWLNSLRHELASRRVRALAVKRDRGPLTSTWVDQLDGDRQLVQLAEPSFTAADPLSFAARALRGELLTLEPGFALIIDGSLRRRHLLRYGRTLHKIPASDLLASIDAIRGHTFLDRAA